MHPIAQIAEPSARAFAVELLDAGVVVGGCDDSTGHGHPVLRGAVLEGDLCGFVLLEVGEFSRVLVGEEEEVGSDALDKTWSASYELVWTATSCVVVGNWSEDLPWQ